MDQIDYMDDIDDVDGMDGQIYSSKISPIPVGVRKKCWNVL